MNKEADKRESPDKAKLRKLTSASFPNSAILLLGATGSGKTPLGQLMETRCLCSRRCIHFDLGENMRRAVAAPGDFRLLLPADLKIVEESLQTGRLLHDSEFHIARKILLSFAQKNGAGERDILVLNGLPRHIGQADAIDEVVHIMAVVYLECSASIVVDRIKLNTGGDRTRRIDDSPDKIAEKLRVFEQHTLPLLDHYRGKGVRIIEVDVNADSTPMDMMKTVEEYIEDCLDQE